MALAGRTSPSSGNKPVTTVIPTLPLRWPLASVQEWDTFEAVVRQNASDPTQSTTRLLLLMSGLVRNGSKANRCARPCRHLFLMNSTSARLARCHLQRDSEKPRLLAYRWSATACI